MRLLFMNRMSENVELAAELLSAASGAQTAAPADRSHAYVSDFCVAIDGLELCSGLPVPKPEEGVGHCLFGREQPVSRRHAGYAGRSACCAMLCWSEKGKYGF